MLKVTINIAVFGAFVLMALVFGFFLWQTLFVSKEYTNGQPKAKPPYSEQKSAPENLSGSSLTPSQSNGTDDAIAEYTKWLAIFTLFLVLATIGLFVSGERNVEVARGSAAAARQSAEVAEKALTNVERPVLLITMPDGAVALPQPGYSPNLPVYAFVAENIGKQIGTIITGNASFTVQTDSVPPLPVMDEPPSGAFCHIRIIGEITIRPGPDNKVGFVCQRSTPLTAEENAGLEDRTSYGFFRVSLVYADPVGTLRSSVYVFVYLPKNTPNRATPLIQVTSKDVVLTQATAEQQKAAQRKLVGSLLKFYWELDKRALNAGGKKADPKP